MAFVVPGVARFTIHQTYEGREVANVLDMRIDTTGTVTDRDDAVSDQAGVIINQWAADVLPDLQNSMTFDSVSWVDLDEADGSVGERTSTGSVTLPDPGGTAEAGLPGSVAILVTKQVPRRRGRRSGRMYICGLTEPRTDVDNGNLMSTAALALYQGNMNSFKGNVEQDGTGPLEYTSTICVVTVLTREIPVPPAVIGAPLTGVGTDVENLNVQQMVATQRRRLRG